MGHGYWDGAALPQKWTHSQDNDISEMLINLSFHGFNVLPVSVSEQILKYFSNRLKQGTYIIWRNSTFEWLGNLVIPQH